MSCIPLNYKIFRDGVEIAELEPFDFMEGVDHGMIRPTDLYWMEGMHEKRPVSEILSDLKRSENITDDGKSFLLISRILLIILVIVGLTYCRFSASEKHEIYENQHGWP